MKNLIMSLILTGSIVSCKSANTANTSSNSSLKDVTHQLVTSYDVSNGLTLTGKNLEITSIESFNLSQTYSGTIPSSRLKTSGENVEIIIGADSNSSTPVSFNIKVKTKTSSCETTKPDNTYLSTEGAGIHCESPKTIDGESQPSDSSLVESSTADLKFASTDFSKYSGFPLPPKSEDPASIDDINDDAYCVQLFNIIEKEFPKGFENICF